MILSKEIHERLMKTAPAQIGHHISGGTMDGKIKPIYPTAKIAGPAVTVQILGRDNAMVYYAVEHSDPGSIIVIDRGGDPKYACCGDIMATSAMTCGMGGIVIDGPATDAAGIEELKFPVFCSGIVSITTNVRCQEGAMNIPVCCGGVVVNPGDIIFGDRDGIVVIPPDQLEDLLEKAEAMDEREVINKGKLRSGVKMSEIRPQINDMAKFAAKQDR